MVEQNGTYNDLRLQWSPLADRKTWEALAKKFGKVAKKEKKGARADSGDHHNRRLQVYVGLSEESPNLNVAIIRYDIVGGLSIRERYIMLATDGGVALGFSREAALQKFLAYVVQDEAKRRSPRWHQQSETLERQTPEGLVRTDVNTNIDAIRPFTVPRRRESPFAPAGWLDSACEASAEACARLAQQFPAKGKSPEVIDKLVPKPRGHGRPPDEHVQIRHKVMRKVDREVHQVNGSAEDYCKGLTAERLPTPTPWQRRDACPPDYLTAWNHADPKKRRLFRKRIRNERYKATHPRPKSGTP